MFIRDDQADMRVSLDGQPLFGSWATYSGGDLTSTDAKTRPGGMGHEVTLGGESTRNDATLTIQWADDVIAQFKRLESRNGKGDILIKANWLDADGVSVPGAVYGRSGKLKGCSDPNYDHNGNAVGFLTIVVSLNELGN
jgi:hypothetical protein